MILIWTGFTWSLQEEGQGPPWSPDSEPKGLFWAIWRCLVISSRHKIKRLLQPLQDVGAAPASLLVPASFLDQTTLKSWSWTWLSLGRFFQEATFRWKTTSGASGVTALCFELWPQWKSVDGGGRGMKRAAAESLTWKLEMCSLSRGLVTDSCPEIGLMMKMPVGGWSAPGPVTL